jgi:hypothetical protein
MRQHQLTTYSILHRNVRMTPAPPPTEPEPSKIHNLGLDEAKKAEFILLDA